MARTRLARFDVCLFVGPLQVCERNRFPGCERVCGGAATFHVPVTTSRLLFARDALLGAPGLHVGPHVGLRAAAGARRACRPNESTNNETKQTLRCHVV